VLPLAVKPVSKTGVQLLRNYTGLLPGYLRRRPALRAAPRTPYPNPILHKARLGFMLNGIGSGPALQKCY
jgi:hypothetical protein